MPRMLRIVPDRCTGCMQCELACSWVQTGGFQPAASLIRVHIFDEEASYTPFTCFQCGEAWCMTACPVNAIAKHAETGAKVVIGGACVGCALCTLACPFGTVYLDAASGKAVKCDLCQGEPACVAACPTRCIEYVEVKDARQAGAWTAALAKTVSQRYHDALAPPSERSEA